MVRQIFIGNMELPFTTVAPVLFVRILQLSEFSALFQTLLHIISRGEFFCQQFQSCCWSFGAQKLRILAVNKIVRSQPTQHRTIHFFGVDGKRVFVCTERHNAVGKNQIVVQRLETIGFDLLNVAIKRAGKRLVKIQQPSVVLQKLIQQIVGVRMFR